MTLRQCDTFATEDAATCGSAAAVCGNSGTFAVSKKAIPRDDDAVK
jgi:hypothetical protein